MPSVTELCKKHFNTDSLYEVLGIEKISDDGTGILRTDKLLAFRTLQYEVICYLSTHIHSEKSLL